MAEINPLLCRPMSLSDYARYCCSGKLPAHVSRMISDAQEDPVLRALLCAMEIIGGLEPLAASRPGVCDPVIVYEHQVTLPAATIAPDGVTIIPSEERIISFCAPTNRALVIEKCRVKPGNEVAARQPVTMPIYKRVNIGTFGEWCLPFEPAPVPMGSFVNIEHIIVPPSAGYSVYVQNYDATGEAIYDVKARMWASC